MSGEYCGGWKIGFMQRSEESRKAGNDPYTFLIMIASALALNKDKDGKFAKKIRSMEPEEAKKSALAIIEAAKPIVAQALIHYDPKHNFKVYYEWEPNTLLAGIFQSLNEFTNLQGRITRQDIAKIDHDDADGIVMDILAFFEEQVEKALNKKGIQLPPIPGDNDSE